MLLPVLEHCLAAVFKPALQVPLIDWGLRDYGTPGQLGLEPTPEEYVANMVEVFREVWRVLRDDGTLWLNLGDSYAGSGKAGNNPEYQKRHIQFGKIEIKERMGKPTPSKKIGLKPKDLVGIPWMVAFALRADGWYLRSDIIWHKPNPMPESVTDRPTNAHEYIFLLSKSKRYFYDAEAIKEETPELSGWAKQRAKGENTWKYNETKERVKQTGQSTQSSTMGETGKRNKRSVWTVSTKPYPGSHFATFPPDLIEPCILAGTSPRACEVCGAPWERVVEKTGGTIGKSWHDHSNDLGKGMSQYSGLSGGVGNAKDNEGKPYTVKTIGWQPTCSCDNKGQAACTVLDPFGGSGTVTMMAEKHGRNSVYIDLNPEYVELAKERCGFGNKLIDTATYEVVDIRG